MARSEVLVDSFFRAVVSLCVRFSSQASSYLYLGGWPGAVDPGGSLRGSPPEGGVFLPHRSRGAVLNAGEEWTQGVAASS